MSESSFVSQIPVAAADPVFHITDLFNKDTNPQKVNLGIGVYADENGKVPLLASVQRAETAIEQQQLNRSYAPINGLPSYCAAVKRFLFGDDEAVLERISTVQSIAGTGALSVAAHLLAKFLPVKEVWVSTPTWANHIAIFSAAGLAIKSYPYFDKERNGLDFSAFRDALQNVTPGSAVVVQACCHNPTGADPTPEQWQELISIIKARALVPIIDMAYQGFCKSVVEDKAVVDAFVKSGIFTLVANSFSKNFSLYSERVGALSLIAATPQEAAALSSQAAQIVRSFYSNPPFHGAKVVTDILSDSDLYAQWEGEINAMRSRIKAMRNSLVAGLGERFAFINQQNGMFSFSGLSAPQMQKLRQECSVYGLDSGRICVAALNPDNIDYVVASIKSIL